MFLPFGRPIGSRGFSNNTSDGGKSPLSKKAIGTSLIKRVKKPRC